MTFSEQLDEGVREGWISADERKQLEELRELTWDAITVDDFDHSELIAGSSALKGIGSFSPASRTGLKPSIVDAPA